MRPAVIERQRGAMEAAGLDALVAISPENFAYTTGFVVPTQPLMRWRHNAAVVTRDGRTALLSVDMEATTVRSRAPGVDVRVWGEFTDRPMATLAALLGDLGLAGAAIGLEMDYLPAGDWEHLRTLLPKARGRGRVMACEIMVATPAIRALIRDDKIHQIYSAMQAGKKHGMQTMNDSLYQLYMNREVAKEECLRATSDPTEFLWMLGETPVEEQDFAPVDGKTGRPTALRR